MVIRGEETLLQEALDSAKLEKLKKLHLHKSAAMENDQNVAASQEAGSGNQNEE